MLKDLFKKFIEVVGVPAEKKAEADKFIAALPDDLPPKQDPPKNDPAKPLTAEEVAKIVSDALTKQAQNFNAEIEKIRTGQTGEKVEQAIQKLIQERRLAPKDEAGIKSAKELLTANYESGLAVLGKLPVLAPEKENPAPQPGESMKKTIAQTDGGRSLDTHLLNHVSNIPSITL